MVYTWRCSRFVPLKIFGRESGEMFRLVLKYIPSDRHVGRIYTF
jgi:hypothetical protein